MYQVKFKTSAAKEFQKLPSQVKQRLQIAINHLKTDPHPRRLQRLIRMQILA